MTEPSERDIKAAAEWAGDKPRAFILALAGFRAAARAEERERCAKVVQEYAELWEIAVAPLVDHIRSGQ